MVGFFRQSRNKETSERYSAKSVINSPIKDQFILLGNAAGICSLLSYGTGEIMIDF